MRRLHYLQNGRPRVSACGLIANRPRRIKKDPGLVNCLLCLHILEIRPLPMWPELPVREVVS